MNHDEYDTTLGVSFEIMVPTTGIASALAIALIVFATRSAQAQTFTTLYEFTPSGDGSNPVTPLMMDSSGNLYGTTYDTIFKLDTSGKFTTVHAFQGFRPPNNINGPLYMTANGSFYGSSFTGGFFQDGTVFKVSSFGKANRLWQFEGDDPPEYQDGANPSNLIRDAKGNFYGTTRAGGVCRVQSACDGTVFKIDLKSNPVEQILYTFTGGSDGGQPEAGLVRDAANNLYGTTAEGGRVPCGESQFGCGTVFKLDTTGKETVLYAFDITHGLNPSSDLIRDSVGNLYGTTSLGGELSCPNSGGLGCGVVFRVSKMGHETVLYAFTGSTDGVDPVAGLVRDSAGNLYGTAYQGGDFSCPVGNSYGCGVVFKIDTSGKFTVLHAFTGGDDGAFPDADLILDSAGNIYGTTPYGGIAGCYGQKGCGVVFKITP